MKTLVWEPDRPLDLGLCLARFVRWGYDPVNVVSGGAYYRVAAGSTPYRAQATDDGSIEVAVSEGEEPEAALEDLRYRMGEPLPFGPVAALAARDERVAGLVEDFPGFRPPLVVDPFEMLVSAICAQQLNLRFATTLRRRLVERYGIPHPVLGATVWEFPSPSRLAQVEGEELQALQFSSAKARSLIELGRAAVEGALAGLEELSEEAIVDRVTSLRGVGRWTAEWLMARCLARPDVVAAGDLGVRKAVSFLYLNEEVLLTEHEVRAVVERWGDAANWTTHLLLERLVRRAGTDS